MLFNLTANLKMIGFKTDTYSSEYKYNHSNARYHMKLKFKKSYIITLALSLLLSGTSFAQVGEDVGEGPAFNNPRGTGQDAAGNLIVADFGTGNVIRVDGVTGDRQLLSEASNTAQGPILVQPGGVVVLEGDRIFVAELALDSVFEIDPVTGDRTTLVDGEILGPFGITSGVINGEVTLIVSSTGSPADGDEVGPVLVDPDTGEITLIPVPADNTIQFNDSRSVAYLDP